MWKFVGSLAVAGIAYYLRRSKAFSHEEKNPPPQGLFHRPKDRTGDHNPKNWKFVGALAIAGIAYYYYQRRRGEESIAPRPPPSTQRSDKRPSPAENSRRKPPEKSTPKVSAPLSPSPSPSTPSLFSSNPSPSPQISQKKPSPSPVENYRRIPTEVSAPLHSKKVELPRCDIPEHLKEQILERFPEKSTPTPKVSSPLSPSLKAFRASTSSPLSPSPKAFRASTSSPLSPSPKAFRASTSSPSKKVELPRYEIPEHLKEEIKKDIVPSVLKMPLHALNYADYFGVLLYAEDFYSEKWSEYLLSDVTLRLSRKETKKNNKRQMGKDFVEIEIDSVPERRPYLLSRDYVRLQPSGRKVESFQGVLVRVASRTTVLAEFKDDFHTQHSPSKKYDVSFSINRVCLKRSHRTISTAMDPLLSSILFPDPSSRINSLNLSTNMFSSAQGTEYGPLQVIRRILNLKDPAPYLIEGPLSEASPGSLSSTGTVIKDTILQICRTSPRCRILVCAPRNRTCDALTRSLLKDIPNSKLFRANAAFRDYDLVPDDIIPQCLYEHEYFTCPSLSELQEFKIVTSTFISTFRLYAAGIAADHFTHIFLVDASSTTEPAAVVALANLVSKKTVIVVTGSSKDIPVWVRSDIARRNGLKRSFFRRLLERHPYSANDPRFISHVTW